MTETNFQKQIVSLKSSHQEAADRELWEKEQRKETIQKTETQLQDVFRQFGKDVVQCDEHLAEVEPEPEQSVGIVIFYTKRTKSVQPSFSISATSTPDSVKVKVSDGKWRQVPGTLGAWADWTDEETVYEGSLDYAAIRNTLESAFLNWYKMAMSVPDEHGD